MHKRMYSRNKTNGPMREIVRMPITLLMVCSTSWGWAKFGVTPSGGGMAPTGSAICYDPGGCFWSADSCYRLIVGKSCQAMWVDYHPQLLLEKRTNTGPCLNRSCFDRWEWSHDHDLICQYTFIRHHGLQHLIRINAWQHLKAGREHHPLEQSFQESGCSQPSTEQYQWRGQMKTGVLIFGIVNIRDARFLLRS